MSNLGEWETGFTSAERKEFHALALRFGGEFHGPNVEHLSISEQDFYRMMDFLRAKLPDTGLPDTEHLPTPLTPEARATWMEFLESNPKAKVPGAVLAFAFGAFIAHDADAEIGRLVRQKLTSWNEVPVERCTVTSAEVRQILEPKPTGETP